MKKESRKKLKTILLANCSALLIPIIATTIISCSNEVDNKSSNTQNDDTVAPKTLSNNISSSFALNSQNNNVYSGTNLDPYLYPEAIPSGLNVLKYFWYHNGNLVSNNTLTSTASIQSSKIQNKGYSNLYLDTNTNNNGKWVLGIYASKSNNKPEMYYSNPVTVTISTDYKNLFNNSLTINGSIILDSTNSTSNTVINLSSDFTWNSNSENLIESNYSSLNTSTTDSITYNWYSSNLTKSVLEKLLSSSNINLNNSSIQYLGSEQNSNNFNYFYNVNETLNSNTYFFCLIDVKYEGANWQNVAVSNIIQYSSFEKVSSSSNSSSYQNYGDSGWYNNGQKVTKIYNFSNPIDVTDSQIVLLNSSSQPFSDSINKVLSKLFVLNSTSLNFSSNISSVYSEYEQLLSADSSLPSTFSFFVEVKTDTNGSITTIKVPESFTFQDPYDLYKIIPGSNTFTYGTSSTDNVTIFSYLTVNSDVYGDVKNNSEWNLTFNLSNSSKVKVEIPITSFTTLQSSYELVISYQLINKLLEENSSLKNIKVQEISSLTISQTNNGFTTSSVNIQFVTPAFSNYITNITISGNELDNFGTNSIYTKTNDTYSATSSLNNTITYTISKQTATTISAVSLNTVESNVFTTSELATINAKLLATISNNSTTSSSATLTLTASFFTSLQLTLPSSFSFYLTFTSSNQSYNSTPVVVNNYANNNYKLANLSGLSSQNSLPITIISSQTNNLPANIQIEGYLPLYASSASLLATKQTNTLNNLGELFKDLQTTNSLNITSLASGTYFVSEIIVYSFNVNNTTYYLIQTTTFPTTSNLTIIQSVPTYTLNSNQLIGFNEGSILGNPQATIFPASSSSINSFCSVNFTNEWKQEGDIIVNSSNSNNISSSIIQLLEQQFYIQNNSLAFYNLLNPSDSNDPQLLSTSTWEELNGLTVNITIPFINSVNGYKYNLVISGISFVYINTPIEMSTSAESVYYNSQTNELLNSVTIQIIPNSYFNDSELNGITSGPYTYSWVEDPSGSAEPLSSTSNSITIDTLPSSDLLTSNSDGSKTLELQGTVTFNNSYVSFDQTISINFIPTKSLSPVVSYDNSTFNTTVYSTDQQYKLQAPNIEISNLPSNTQYTIQYKWYKYYNQYNKTYLTNNIPSIQDLNNSDWTLLQNQTTNNYYNLSSDFYNNGNNTYSLVVLFIITIDGENYYYVSGLYQITMDLITPSVTITSNNNNVTLYKNLQIKTYPKLIPIISSNISNVNYSYQWYTTNKYYENDGSETFNGVTYYKIPNATSQDYQLTSNDTTGTYLIAVSASAIDWNSSAPYTYTFNIQQNSSNNLVTFNTPSSTYSLQWMLDGNKHANLTSNITTILENSSFTYQWYSLKNSNVNVLSANNDEFSAIENANASYYLLNESAINAVGSYYYALLVNISVDGAIYQVVSDTYTVQITEYVPNVVYSNKTQNITIYSQTPGYTLSVPNTQITNLPTNTSSSITYNWYNYKSGNSDYVTNAVPSVNELVDAVPYGGTGNSNWYSLLSSSTSNNSYEISDSFYTNGSKTYTFVALITIKIGTESYQYVSGLYQVTINPTTPSVTITSNNNNVTLYKNLQIKTYPTLIPIISSNISNVNYSYQWYTTNKYYENDGSETFNGVTYYKIPNATSQDYQLTSNDTTGTYLIAVSASAIDWNSSTPYTYTFNIQQNSSNNLVTFNTPSGTYSLQWMLDANKETNLTSNITTTLENSSFTYQWYSLKNSNVNVLSANNDEFSAIENANASYYLLNESAINAVGSYYYALLVNISVDGAIYQVVSDTYTVQITEYVPNVVYSNKTQNITIYSQTPGYTLSVQNIQITNLPSGVSSSITYNWYNYNYKSENISSGYATNDAPTVNDLVNAIPYGGTGSSSWDCLLSNSTSNNSYEITNWFYTNGNLTYTFVALITIKIGTESYQYVSGLYQVTINPTTPSVTISSNSQNVYLWQNSSSNKSLNPIISSNINNSGYSYQWYTTNKYYENDGSETFAGVTYYKIPDAIYENYVLNSNDLNIVGSFKYLIYASTSLNGTTISSNYAFDINILEVPKIEINTLNSANITTTLYNANPITLTYKIENALSNMTFNYQWFSTSTSGWATNTITGMTGWNQLTPIISTSNSEISYTLTSQDFSKINQTIYYDIEVTAYIDGLSLGPIYVQPSSTNTLYNVTTLFPDINISQSAVAQTVYKSQENSFNLVAPNYTISNYSSSENVSVSYQWYNYNYNNSSYQTNTLPDIDSLSNNSTWDSISGATNKDYGLDSWFWDQNSTFSLIVMITITIDNVSKSYLSGLYQLTISSTTPSITITSNNQNIYIPYSTSNSTFNLDANISSNVSGLTYSYEWYTNNPYYSNNVSNDGYYLISNADLQNFSGSTSDFSKVGTYSYKLIVTGENSAITLTSSYVFTVNIFDVPTISVQTDQTTFSTSITSAGGALPLLSLNANLSNNEETDFQYSWYYSYNEITGTPTASDGSLIAGANSSSYRLNSSYFNSNYPTYYYFVIVTTVYNGVSIQAVSPIFTVNISFSSPTNPVEINIMQSSYIFNKQNPNISIPLSVQNLSDNYVVEYSWYFSTSNTNDTSDTIRISNSNSPILTALPSWAINISNVFYVFCSYTIINLSEKTFTSGVTQTIKVTFQNTTPSLQASAYTTYLGQGVSLSINNISGLNWVPTKYNWEEYIEGSWQTIEQSTATTYTFVPTSVGDYEIRVVATNLFQNQSYTISSISISCNAWANVTISAPNMSNNSITVNNDSVTLSSTLSNNNFTSPTYQWQELSPTLGWTNIEGANSSTYIVNNVFTYIDEYRLIVMNDNNSTESSVSNIITVNVTPNWGTFDFSSNNVASVTEDNVETFNISSGQKITITATLSNSNIDSNIINYQWQEYINNSWTNISNTTNNITLTGSERYQVTLRLVASITDYSYSGYSSTSQEIVVQVPLSSSQMNDLKTQVNTWMSSQTNQLSLLTNYFNNTGASLIIGQLNQWCWTYLLNGLSDSNWKTEISSFTFSFASNGTLEATTHTLNSNLYLTVWQDSSDKTTISENTTIVIYLPYSLSTVKTSTGSIASYYDLDISAVGQVNLYLKNNLADGSDFNETIEKDSAIPYGMKFLNSSGDSIFSSSFFSSFASRFPNAASQSIIPFNIMYDPSSTTSITINSSNSNLPNFSNLSKISTLNLFKDISSKFLEIMYIKNEFIKL